MIANFIINMFLSVLSFVFSYFPENRQVELYDLSYEIYGYSVYMLGSDFFYLFLAGLVSTLFAWQFWFFIVFVFDKVRGSG